MKTIKNFILLLTTVSIIGCSADNGKFLEIKGKVVNTEAKSIQLMKPNQDMRFDSLITIPVENGVFYYKAKLKNPEAVDLMLGGGEGRFIPLFLENEKIDLTICSEEEFNKNIVIGGNLNAQYKKYRQDFENRFNKITKLNPTLAQMF